MRIRVEVDGFTFEGHWLSTHPRPALHVVGPLEYRYPARGSYRDGEWDDQSGPQGRPQSVRHARWWAAASKLRRQFEDWRETEGLNV